MRRSHALLAVVLLAAAVGVAYPVLTSSRSVDAVADAPASAPGARAADPDVFGQDPVCTMQQAESATPLTAESCGRCPPEWPRCNRNRDCDAVCGGKGTGVCEWINSCFKCCTCGGTT